MTIIPTNTKIRAYLSSRRDLAMRRFDVDTGPLREAMNRLAALDFATYQAQNEAELRFACDDHWQLVEEPVDGILFEYDYYSGGKADADAYGIPFGDFRADQVEPYGFGWHDNFAPGFEAAPGVRLRIMELTAALAEQYDHDNHAYQSVKEAHRLTSFLVLHDALARFVNTPTFGKLKRLNPFCFVVQEHDSGYTYPLYVVQ